jgi:hypothetical protein
VGVWVEKFITMGPRLETTLPEGEMPPGPRMMPGMMPGMDPEVARAYERRYGIRMGGAGMPPAPVAEPAAEAPPNPEMPPPQPNPDGTMPEATPGATAVNTNEVATVTVVCRGVDLTPVSASANTELAFAVLKELQNSPLLDAEGTQFEGSINLDPADGTFTFGITLKLKKPLVLY